MKQRNIGWSVLFLSLVCSFISIILIGSVMSKANTGKDNNNSTEIKNIGEILPTVVAYQMFGGFGVVLFFISIVILIFARD
jgi:hypothetical protein